MTDQPTYKEAIDEQKQKLGQPFKDFLFAMEERLVEKAQQGWSQWDNPALIPDEVLKEKAIECMNNGDFVDAANYNLFLHYRQEMDFKSQHVVEELEKEFS